MDEIQSFFTEEIPKRFQDAVVALEQRLEQAKAAADPSVERLQARLDGIRQLEATLRFQLTGDGGRDYFLNQKGATLEVSDAPAVPPVVWIAQDVAHFRGLHKLGAGRLEGATIRVGGPLRPSVVDQIKTFNSVLKLVMTDAPELPEAVTWVRLGPEATKDDPDMTLSLSYDTFKQIARREIQPPQAFMMGLLRIEGDMGIAMRLAALGMGG